MEYALAGSEMLSRIEQFFIALDFFGLSHMLHITLVQNRALNPETLETQCGVAATKAQKTTERVDNPISLGSDGESPSCDS